MTDERDDKPDNVHLLPGARAKPPLPDFFWKILEREGARMEAVRQRIYKRAEEMEQLRPGLSNEMLFIASLVEEVVRLQDCIDQLRGDVRSIDQRVDAHDERLTNLDGFCK